MSDERTLSVVDSDQAARAHVSLAELMRVAESDPRLRFELELEFVESLANPDYLYCACRQRHTAPRIS